MSITLSVGSQTTLHFLQGSEVLSPCICAASRHLTPMLFISSFSSVGLLPQLFGAQIISCHRYSKVHGNFSADLQKYAEKMNGTRTHDQAIELHLVIIGIIKYIILIMLNVFLL